MCGCGGVRERVEGVREAIDFSVTETQAWKKLGFFLLMPSFWLSGFKSAGFD